MDDIYENIEEYNPKKKQKILLLFGDMIVDMLSNKKLNPIVTDLFIRGRKLNISFVFITQSFCVAPKQIRLNCTYYFIMKIPNKRELQQIAFNHSPDINYEGFTRNALQNHILFLVTDTTLASDNPLPSRKSFTKTINTNYHN